MTRGGTTPVPDGPARLGTRGPSRVVTSRLRDPASAERQRRATGEALVRFSDQRGRPPAPHGPRPAAGWRGGRPRAPPGRHRCGQVAGGANRSHGARSLSRGRLAVPAGPTGGAAWGDELVGDWRRPGRASRAVAPWPWVARRVPCASFRSRGLHGQDASAPTHPGGWDGAGD